MSKKKKKRRIKRSVPLRAVDRHHCLFIGRLWEKSPYGNRLRHIFIYPIPIVIHRELHNRIITNVPVPSEELLKNAWNKYLEEKDAVDTYDICRAIAWLYVAIPDPAFREAMQKQLDFFTAHLR